MTAPTNVSHLYRAIQDTQGNLLPGALVTVCPAGLTTPITDTLYADRGLTQPLTNPFSADNGIVSVYLASPRTVTLRVAYNSRLLVIDYLQAEPNVETLLSFATAVDVAPSPVAGKLLGATDANTLAWVDPPTGGGGGGFNVRGDWQPNVAYAEGDLVLWQDGLYQADNDQTTPLIQGLGVRHIVGSGSLTVPLPDGITAPREYPRGGTLYVDNDVVLLTIVVNRGRTTPADAAIPPSSGSDPATTLPYSAIYTEVDNLKADGRSTADSVVSSFGYFYATQEVIDQGSIPIPDQGHGDQVVVFAQALRGVYDVVTGNTVDAQTQGQFAGIFYSLQGTGHFAWRTHVDPEGPSYGWQARLSDTYINDSHLMAGVAYAQAFPGPDVGEPNVDYDDNGDMTLNNLNTLDNGIFQSAIIHGYPGPDRVWYGGSWTLIADVIPLGSNTSPYSSIALGQGSETAKGNSLALGYLAATAGNNDVALGYRATTGAGGYSVAIGAQCEVGGTGTAIRGGYVETTATDAIAIDGYAGGIGSTVVGSGAYAETFTEPRRFYRDGAFYATVIGYRAGAYYRTSQYATVLGADAEGDAPASVAIGFASYVGEQWLAGIAIGANTIVGGRGAVAIGSGAPDSTAYDTEFASYDAVGAEAYGLNSIAIGAGANTSGVAVNGVALGAQANAQAVSSAALGDSAQTTGDRSVALGRGPYALGPDCIAIGTDQRVYGDSSISIGVGDALGYFGTRANQAIALGTHALVDIGADNSIAIGREARVGDQTDLITGGLDSIALGHGAAALGGSGIAIGHNATIASTSLRGLAIGEGTSVALYGGVAIGIDSMGTSATSTATDEFVLGTALHTVKILGRIQLGSIFIISGTGSPAGAVTAPVGSMFLRSNGGANTTLYVKESGTGNTGWAAK